MKKISWSGVAGLLTSLVGVASSPVVFSMLSPKWAASITAAGILTQAFTPAIHKGETPTQ